MAPQNNQASSGQQVRSTSYWYNVQLVQVHEKYIILSIGDDKRTKKLSLSKKGKELEKKLSDIQITKIYKILNLFNETDINGFKKVLYAMIDKKNQNKFNEIN